jgi:uncharacterized protein (TIGR02266 family)
MSTTESQKGTKGPITLKIKFKSGSLEQFIERYSVDVSRGGIFIRTKDPLAVGTALKFEFQLQDGSPLLSGDGTVVWNRANDPARQSVAPGMGVRFDKLTPDSERVLSRILAEKDRRGDTQKGSRFDDGIRAQSGEGSEAPAPAPSQETPKAGMFGDEPTRAMAADQVNRLAESIKAGSLDEDQPTRRGSVADYSDEVRKFTGASSEGSGSLPAIPSSAIPSAQKMPAMQPMQPIKKPDGLRSTLLGQGFGLGPAATGLINPAAAMPTPGREPSSSGIKAAQIPIPESAVTPVKAADAAQVAESQRTPTGEPDPVSALAKPSQPSPAPIAPGSVPEPTPVAPPQAPEKPAESPVDSRGVAQASSPAAAAIAGSPAPIAPVSLPAAAQQPQPVAEPTPTAASGGAPKGLLIGAALLVLLVAVAGYFVLQGQRPQPTPPVTPPNPPTTNTPPPPPLQPPVLIPEKPSTPTGTDAVKPATDTTKPAEATTKTEPAADGAGQLVTSDPPGAQVELAGKPAGTTPVRIPGLAAGKVYEVRLTLQGFQEVRQKIKVAEDNKAIEIKLVPSERQVEIVSVPKGADVFIDGKRVGRTPWIVRKIEPNKPIKIELRRTGFEVWSHTVSDADTFQLRNKKEVLPLSAVLEPLSKKGGKATAPTKKPAATEAAPAGKTDAPTEAKTEAKPEAKTEAKADEAAKPAEAKQAPAEESAKPAAP